MDADPTSRSPELLSRTNSALLVIDLQEKLLPSIRFGERIVWNVGRLVDGAALFDIPRMATEQYPAGLGPTVSAIAARLEQPPAKQRFSSHGCGDLPAAWSQSGRYKIVVCGIEAHVCVLQTVMDLLSDGFQVHLVTDATGSRDAHDYDIALRRLENHGTVLTTTESVLFEWCETAADPKFKSISALIRQPAPA